MKCFVAAAIGSIVFLQAGIAQAAYRCELFDRAEAAPGGDVPSLIKFTDSNDFDAAKAACSALVDKKTIVDYWLHWIEASKLPEGWKSVDLLPESQKQEPAEPAAENGVACIIYDSLADTPFVTYHAKDSVLRKDKITLDDVVAQCKAIMRNMLPNQYRDFEVRYVKEVPSFYIDIFDPGHGC
jgi:hypothetical protein